VPGARAAISPLLLHPSLFMPTPTSHRIRQAVIPLCMLAQGSFRLAPGLRATVHSPRSRCTQRGLARLCPSGDSRGENCLPDLERSSTAAGHVCCLAAPAHVNVGLEGRVSPALTGPGLRKDISEATLLLTAWISARETHAAVTAAPSPARHGLPAACAGCLSAVREPPRVHAGSAGRVAACRACSLCGTLALRTPSSRESSQRRARAAAERCQGPASSRLLHAPGMRLRARVLLQLLHGQRLPRGRPSTDAASDRCCICTLAGAGAEGSTASRSAGAASTPPARSCRTKLADRAIGLRAKVGLQQAPSGKTPQPQGQAASLAPAIPSDLGCRRSTTPSAGRAGCRQCGTRTALWRATCELQGAKPLEPLEPRPAALLPARASTRLAWTSLMAAVLGTR
jgi:hypothetical protein